MDLPKINLQDFAYPLPKHRIARYPLPLRDKSKLLVYRGGSIGHHQFRQIGEFLPEGTTLVFNDTRVIPARLQFRKETGAAIEIFLLDPVKPSHDINIAMQATQRCTWNCMVGNQKRWKPHQVLQMLITADGKLITLRAEQAAQHQVSFTWDDPALAFVDLVKAAGQVPLPPYLRRNAEPDDRDRYQTVYSKFDGAVAAPTAGLHFTGSLLESLESQGVTKEYLTLHVGAGTFQPIKTDSVIEHPMHGEQIHITLSNIERLINASSLVAVGTTSLRTLESLYWYGVQLLNGMGHDFFIHKLAPYNQYQHLPGFRKSLESVKMHLEKHQQSAITGFTEIFIFPPYQVRSSIGLITNFHLPESTLILLVAAFIGSDWKKVYREALDNNYRFLSYGDSSLLLPSIQN